MENDMLAFSMARPPRPRSVSWVPLFLCALLPLWLDSCTNPRVAGVPDRLPDVALVGSPMTPPHHLASYEYPFDAEGNYVQEWAAEGERHFGRAASATSEDEEKWSTSHGGRSTGPSKAGSRKKTIHQEERHTKAHKSSDESPKKTVKKSTSEGKSKSKSSKSSSDDEKPKKKTPKKSDSDDKPKSKSKSSSSKKSDQN